MADHVAVSQSALYFLTGSSGSGKTTLVQRVVRDYYPHLRTGHVDAPGAPQGGRTWVERAAQPVESGREHIERRRRLLEDRRQPELDLLDMYAWAAYLRGQADALGVEVLDTTRQTIEASTHALATSIAAFAARAGIAL
jgi:ABC-type molybdenum transport system ATPase subunit/photorepair protein PhrA